LSNQRQIVFFGFMFVGSLRSITRVDGSKHRFGVERHKVTSS
jgi:hypothetical protein